jgi:Arc/MetJ-type ribon-helix-helix transcriptional regulator
MTTTVETVAEITARWRREGRSHTVRDAVKEWQRQGCVAARRREDQLLIAAQSLHADEHTRAVAQQVFDHRYHDDGHAVGCGRDH